MMGRACAALLLALWTACLLLAQQSPAKDYWFYVTAESDDEVDLVRFGPVGAKVEKRIQVGVLPTENEGPHGLAVSRDGKYWYVSIAHGYPFGSVYKYNTGTDDVVGSVQVGMFPATLDVASSTGLLYVVNFDLHGDMKPSSLSVVETRSMSEVAQILVGIMPHGSRLNRSGDRQYSVMMMTDELVEVDAFKFEVRRRLGLSEAGKHAAHMMEGDMKGMEMDKMATAKPTWAQPEPSGRYVYVACNGSNEVLEVDLEKWEIRRRFSTAPGPYNLDVTPDSKILVVTEKGNHSTRFWNLDEGKPIARVPNSKKVTHGVAISPDARYAFVSVEGIGGEPGAVDIFDLQSFKLVASVDVGKQAAGIAFWKMR